MINYGFFKDIFRSWTVQSRLDSSPCWLVTALTERYPACDENTRDSRNNGEREENWSQFLNHARLTWSSEFDAINEVAQHVSEWTNHTARSLTCSERFCWILKLTPIDTNFQLGQPWKVGSVSLETLNSLDRIRTIYPIKLKNSLPFRRKICARC